MDQIAKNLAAQKGLQAQAQVGGGLPTIKQKNDQAAQLMLAQTAMAGKGAMPRPMMQAQPAQQQQDQEEPEEAPVQGAADGGIMHVPVHKDMFNFATGGIVAFAGDGPQGQKVKDEAANQTAAYLAGIELQNQANAAPPGEASYTPEPAPSPAPVNAPVPAPVVNDPNAAQRAATRADLARLPAAALDVLQSPMASTLNLAGATASGIGNIGAKVINALTDKDVLPTNMNLNPGFSPTPFSDRLNTPTAAPSSPYKNTTPAVANPSTGSASTQPGTMAEYVPRRPLPASSTPGGINTGTITPPVGNIGAHPGNPTASPSNALPVSNEQTTAAKDYHDQQLARAKAEQDLLDNSKPKSREDLIKSELDLQKLFHIGDYEKLTKDLLAEREKRHNEDKAGRGWNDAMAQLAAFTRPGARWSDVIGTDVRSKAVHEQEDKDFYDVQDKYLDAINKAAEARNEGSVTRIHATELEQTKARQEAVKAVMQSKGIGLNAAEHYIATLNTNAVAKYGHDVSRMNAAERAASQLEIASLKRQAQLDNFDRNYGAALNKTEYGSLSKERAKLQADLAPLAGADQNLAFIKGKKDRLQEIETRMEQIQNAFLGGIANNAAGSTSAPTAKKATYRMENGQIVPNK
jgi:hypothetical protein